uniref:Uncharacterized protein n=1 Tax=Rhizophora mucronata TaxID=61149 RepID=A0A2P2PZP9_RHIMU
MFFFPGHPYLLICCSLCRI